MTRVRVLDLLRLLAGGPNSGQQATLSSREYPDCPYGHKGSFSQGGWNSENFVSAAEER